MGRFPLIGLIVCSLACAGRARVDPASPRNWLPREIGRASTRTERTDLTIKQCWATVTKQHYDGRQSGAKRDGSEQYRLELAGMQATAIDSTVRLVLQNSTWLTRVPGSESDRSLDSHGVNPTDRYVWLSFATPAGAAQIANGFNSLAAECAAREAP